MSVRPRAAGGRRRGAGSPSPRPAGLFLYTGILILITVYTDYSVSAVVTAVTLARAPPRNMILCYVS